jgi:hypothetical protein
VAWGEGCRCGDGYVTCSHVQAAAKYMRAVLQC